LCFPLAGKEDNNLMAIVITIVIVLLVISYAYHWKKDREIIEIKEDGKTYRVERRFTHYSEKEDE